MSAYFGGRSECAIRRTPVPVTYLDYLSMYPTLNLLLGNWRFLIAQRIDTESDLRSVRTFLQNITLEDMLKPETWRDLHVLVRARPEGDVLPVRAMYGKRSDYRIGVNGIASEEPL